MSGNHDPRHTSPGRNARASPRHAAPAGLAQAGWSLITENMKHVIFTAVLLATTTAMPAVATGFSDLASCFTAEKATGKKIRDIGECRISARGSWGSGDGLSLSINGRVIIDADTPGRNSSDFGKRGTLVNGQPGELDFSMSQFEEGVPTMYCAYRYTDSVAYCALPYNHGTR